MLLRISLCALLPVILAAQSISGTIVGAIEDPGGLSISGAQVSLTQVATGASRRTKTIDSGGFTFANVEPGQYSLHVEAAGFKTTQIDSIILTASETRSIGNLRMEVGNVTQSVTIEARGAI